jgi:hypothetical protein
LRSCPERLGAVDDGVILDQFVAGKRGHRKKGTYNIYQT